MKEKPCKICGKLFMPYCSSNVICSDTHLTHCPICGKEMIWNSTRKVEPCSKECKKELTRRNNLEKYGVEHPMQSKEVQSKHREAMLNKYGVASPLQSAELKQKASDSIKRKFGTAWALSSREVKEKAKKTMKERYGGETTLESSILRKKVEETVIKKYGVHNVMQNYNVKNKASNTCFIKYGVANPMQVDTFNHKAIETRIEHYGTHWTPEMQQRAIQTWMQNYGTDNPSKNPEIIKKIKNTVIERYGENYAAYFLRNARFNTISNINKSFMKALNEHGIEGEFEFSEIPKYRYDIAIRNQKILIEINPTYTHNTIGNHWTAEGISIDYHLRKTQAAIENGYRCIHVFDWDDWDKIINLVTPKHIIHARDCKLYKLNEAVATRFLDRYHIEGHSDSQVIQLGLVKESELLQVMTFSKINPDSGYYIELSRLCTHPNYIVLGGASRLFKFATEQLCIDEIISYCDLAKFQGDVCSYIDMKLTAVIPPQQIWSRGDQKLILDRNESQKALSELSSTEISLIQDGWLPVYDCGKAVFTYKHE